VVCTARYREHRGERERAMRCAACPAPSTSGPSPLLLVDARNRARGPARAGRSDSDRAGTRQGRWSPVGRRAHEAGGPHRASRTTPRAIRSARPPALVARDGVAPSAPSPGSTRAMSRRRDPRGRVDRPHPPRQGRSLAAVAADVERTVAATPAARCLREVEASTRPRGRRVVDCSASGDSPRRHVSAR
jgi:hypothetical protein